MGYLERHWGLNREQIATHDKAGTLSHWLLIQLVRYEEVQMKKRQKLPPLVDPQLSMRLQPKLTDAEAVTALSGAAEVGEAGEHCKLDR